MPATAENLRDLHELHQRAKALRDRLASGPKTVVSRQAILAKRQADLDAAREGLKKFKADIKNKEVQVQSIRARTDELRTRLNSIKKQVEYDALRNQIAHDNSSAAKIEDEILELMGKAEAREAEIKTQEAEFQKLNGEVAKLSVDVETKAEGQRAQLAELERAIEGAEAIISEDQRERYRRTIKQRGADALAAVEGSACTGCFVTVTPQMVNELINANTLVFCNTCGRLLYLAADDEPGHRGGR